MFQAKTTSSKGYETNWINSLQLKPFLHQVESIQNIVFRYFSPLYGTMFVCAGNRELNLLNL